MGGAVTAKDGVVKALLNQCGERRTGGAPARAGSAGYDGYISISSTAGAQDIEHRHLSSGVVNSPRATGSRASADLMLDYDRCLG